MQNTSAITDETSDYLYPAQRKAAIARLAELEAELAAHPTDPGLKALVRSQKDKVRWYERKKGDRANVGTVSLCSRPTSKRSAAQQQAQVSPVVGLSALLPSI